MRESWVLSTKRHAVWLKTLPSYIATRPIPRCRVTYDRVLEGYEKLLGPGHADTLVLSKTSQCLPAARKIPLRLNPMYGRALAGWEKTSRTEHLETLRIIENLAVVYQSEGRYSEAEVSYKRALLR